MSKQRTATRGATGCGGGALLHLLRAHTAAKDVEVLLCSIKRLQGWRCVVWSFDDLSRQSGVSCGCAGKLKGVDAGVDSVGFKLALDIACADGVIGDGSADHIGSVSDGFKVGYAAPSTDEVACAENARSGAALDVRVGEDIACAVAADDAVAEF